MIDYKGLLDMTGKVCLVTGGIGYLCSGNVQMLKAFGATVAVADIRQTEERWAGAPESAADLLVYCDIFSTQSIRDAFKTVYDKYGRIDVLVNGVSAGGGHGANSFLETTSDEAWEKGLNGVLGPTFRCTREILPYMKKTGGSIINYCSMYGLVAPDLGIYADPSQRQPAVYGTAKGGVLQFTRYCASALAKYGIRVNCVTPGPFPNPRNRANETFNQNLSKKTMLGRLGANHEMAGAVLLLASDAGSYMTGSNITVDGGWTAW